MISSILSYSCFLHLISFTAKKNDSKFDYPENLNLKTIERCLDQFCEVSKLEPFAESLAFILKGKYSQVRNLQPKIENRTTTFEYEGLAKTIPQVMSHGSEFGQQVEKDYLKNPERYQFRARLNEDVEKNPLRQKDVRTKHLDFSSPDALKKSAEKSRKW